MNNNSKVGLIIQGPLMSKGRSGFTIVKKFSQLTKEDIINYNCNPNIIDIYLEYSRSLMILFVLHGTLRIPVN